MEDYLVNEMDDLVCTIGIEEGYLVYVMIQVDSLDYLVTEMECSVT